MTYCLLCTAYTVVNIPLNTIVPRLSAAPNERNILVTTRMVCALIGTAIVMSITTPFVEFAGKIFDPGMADPFKSPRAWVVVMGVYGVAAMLVFFLTFASTKEVVPPSVQNETSSLKDNILFLSIAIYLAGNALILVNQMSVPFQMVGLTVTGLGIYGIFGTVFAMQPDAIDYSEWKKNRSISGTIAAFQGLFVKASMGLASWIIGLYLGMNGYNGELSTQSAAAKQSIQFHYMWIPVILCILLAVTNLFYKLDSCAVRMRAELDERRKILLEKSESQEA